MLRIVVEGGVGEGKSTLAAEVARLLGREGFDVQIRDLEAGHLKADAQHTVKVESMKGRGPVLVTTGFSERRT